MPTLLHTSENVRLQIDGVELEGEFSLPPEACGLVVFAHGSGSSHLSPRNHRLAHALQQAGIGTLLFDLLTRCEDASDITHLVRFDIERLTRRLLGATDWLREKTEGLDLGLGYFGASTGAAAALCAAAQRPENLRAIVCRSGRPDLADRALTRVQAPTLLIVGGWDDVVLQLNREALRRITAEKRLEVVPRATHLFDEPGALEEVARLTTRWFSRHFQSAEQLNPS